MANLDENTKKCGIDITAGIFPKLSKNGIQVTGFQEIYTLVGKYFNQGVKNAQKVPKMAKIQIFMG